jgi:hypothetical protein
MYNDIEILDNTILDEFNKNEDINMLLIQYFENPILEKIKNDDSEMFSIYATKLYCLLNRECRYIMIVKKFDKNPIGSKIKLKDINWISFQTRTLEIDYDVDVHNYNQNKVTTLSNYIVEKEKNDDICTVYTCNMIPNIKITLLNKKNNIYQTKGTILSCLNTFQTIILKT